MSEQMILLVESDFEHSLKWRERHYVPILKSLPGEVGALQVASNATWDRMTPLIEAREALGDIDEPPLRSTYPNLAGRLGAAITAGRPFFLDFPWLDSRAVVKVGQGTHKTTVNAIEHVFESCRASGLLFIPVLAPGHDAQRAALVKAALERDGRGICLRIPIAGVVWEGSIAKSIDVLLAKTGARPYETDLLLDLSYIPTPPGFGARHIKSLIEGLPNLSDWRGLIVAGTVIPASATGWKEDAVTELIRHEWHLYQELRQLAPERMPTFGDYAVQHPQPPRGGGIGKRASIRYTTEQVVLYARGRSDIEYGREQYRKLCQMLLQRSEFCGAAYTWGDGFIADTAVSTTRPNGEPAWRRAGTSHHLRFVTDSLARP